jgi:hypothetical protein
MLQVFKMMANTVLEPLNPVKPQAKRIPELL